MISLEFICAGGLRVLHLLMLESNRLLGGSVIGAMFLIYDKTFNDLPIVWLFSIGSGCRRQCPGNGWSNTMG
jgi:hypothetical protein